MKLKEVKEQKILLSVLNWGMGHVARSIALIRVLLEQQNEILIACDERQQKVFANYFDHVSFVDHSGYPFNFSGKGNFATDIFDNRKNLLKRFVDEQQQVETYVNTFQIDLVISDHRYGFFSKQVPSIFVTHQIYLPLKWFQWPAQWYHRGLIKNNFTGIWCIDDEHHSMAGKLSFAKQSDTVTYLGTLSRFSAELCENENYILAIVSGPEPYARHFLDEIIAVSSSVSEEVICVIPEAYEHTPEIPSNLKIVVADDWQVTDVLFMKCRMVISRAGYSTLMDLKQLQKKAVLVPTPGQTEQLYLGKLHRNTADWTFVKHLKDFDFSGF